MTHSSAWGRHRGRTRSRSGTRGGICLQEELHAGSQRPAAILGYAWDYNKPLLT